MDDDAITTTIDYLGRQQPIGQRAVSALPGESGGGGPTAPVTPGMPGVPGAPGAASPLGRVGAPQVPAFARALSGLLGVNKGLQFARALMGNEGDLGSAIGAAGGLGGGGAESTLASFFGEGIGQSEIESLLAQFPGGSEVASQFANLGSLGAEAGGEAAALGTEAAMQGANMSMSAAGPIWAGLTAAVDFLGEGKIPFVQGIIDMIDPSILGPSEAWRTFGTRLGPTLQGEDAATTGLARSLMGAQGQDAVQRAIAEWKASVGQTVPGFGAGSGPLEMPGLPGATGSRHEGRAVADFSTIQTGLQALEQAALQGLPTDQRMAAFSNAVQPILQALAAEQARRRQEIDSISEWQGGQQNQGSF